MLARSVRMAAAEAPPDVTRGKVIVIGRGRLTQRLLSSGLGRGGFDVESAVDGDEGQALVRRHDPDAVILLDMLAPLDGVSLLEAIRSETACPVVMLDARDDSAPSIVGFARSANDTVERPNALGELLSLIGGALRQRSLRVRDAALAAEAKRASL
jgi:DNA-binding response OmpR family regulator